MHLAVPSLYHITGGFARKIWTFSCIELLFTRDFKLLANMFRFRYIILRFNRTKWRWILEEWLKDGSNISNTIFNILWWSMNLDQKCGYTTLEVFIFVCNVQCTTFTFYQLCFESYYKPTFLCQIYQF